MKSYDYEAVVFEGGVYCNECIPEEATEEECQPIFAGSEWDCYPVCESCGGVHDYVSLTEEGIENEGIEL